MARYARRPPGKPRPQGPWKNGTIPVLGLVGGIGAGKSYVASKLAERGAFVVDADAVGHALLQQSPSRDLVYARFGDDILDPAGLIDRAALGEIVFSHPSARGDLEAILHPRMRKTFERAIDRAVRRGEAPAVVLDAAILYEAGWGTMCDLVAFVEAPDDLRLARVASQRGWDAEMLETRACVQSPLDAKRKRTSVIVRNDGDPEALAADIDALWTRLMSPPPPQAPPRPRPAPPPGPRAVLNGIPSDPIRSPCVAPAPSARPPPSSPVTVRRGVSPPCPTRPAPAGNPAPPAPVGPPSPRTPPTTP